MVLKRLAEYAVSLDLSVLDKEVTESACLCLLDAVECFYDTFEDNRTKSALEMALGESGNCTLFGRKEKSSADGAVLYNTVTGSVASRNDMNIEGNAHPGTALVPLVLALGEERHESGKLVLEAMIIGYEILSRLGRSLRTGNAAIPKALRPTSLCIAVAAAFCCSKIFGFDENLTVNAAALACNYVAGLNEWRFEGTGEDVFLNAFAAQFGLKCARLTASGMRASETNLDGEFGFLSLFNAVENSQLITRDLGADLAVTATRHKPVAACRALQSVCLLADRMSGKQGFDIASVSRIELTVSEEIKNNPWYFRKEKVENLVQAILSIPFGFASGLAAGNHEEICWVPPYDAKVVSLMEKTEIFFDGGLGRDSVRAAVLFSDGNSIEDCINGFPFFSACEIREYFARRMPKFIGEERTARILGKYNATGTMQDIREFISLFD